MQLSNLRVVLLVVMFLTGVAGRAETVTVTTDANQPPFTDISKSDGGIATRKVIAAFRAAGMAPELDWLPWRRGLSETEKGTFAATFPYLKTAERERSFFYSDPIYYDESYLWMRSGAAISLEDASSLSGKTLCVPRGYWSPLKALLSAQIDRREIKVEQPESQETCVRMLAVGHADFMSGEEFEIGPLLLPEDRIVHSPRPIQLLAFHVLFSRKSQNAAELVKRFDLALARIAQEAQAESALASQQVTVITEEFPPYQYSDHGEVSGMSTEVVKAALAEAGISAPIAIMPWARAYKMALEDKNVLIFSLARTKEREALFKWIGQVNEAENYVYARADRGLTISSLEDARQYVTGTVVGDIRESYFLDHGFTLNKDIQSVRQHEQNYAKLRAGRIDLWPTSSTVMAYIVRKAGDDPTSAVTPVWRIDDLHVGYSGDFLAASLSTPDSLVEKLRIALDRIKSDGRYDAIKKKWAR